MRSSSPMRSCPPPERSRCDSGRVGQSRAGTGLVIALCLAARVAVADVVCQPEPNALAATVLVVGPRTDDLVRRLVDAGRNVARGLHAGGLACHGLPVDPPTMAVAVGRAASEALLAGFGCENGVYTILVDPEVSPDAARAFLACARGREHVPVNFVVSSCPGARRQVERLLGEMSRTGVSGFRIVPGCDESLLVEAAHVAGGHHAAEPQPGVEEVHRRVLYHESYVARALGLSVGWGSGADGVSSGVAFAFRPELIFLRHGSGTLGLGAHALLGTVPGGRPVAGGGVDLVVPLTSGLHPAQNDLVVHASAGVYGGEATVSAAGLFVGWRGASAHVWGSEVPLGVRVEAWVGLDGWAWRGVTVSLHVDLLAIGHLGGFLLVR
jgi:hypothetical protein